MLKSIITYPGTGTETVREIIRAVSPRTRLHIVTTLNEARGVRFHGALILGGADLSPHFYGERITYAYAANRKRDAIEWYIMRTALTNNLPIFGICRGHQLLAVALGMGLWQDIYHQARTRRHPSMHRLTKVSRPLRDHIPTTYVNSQHHQAIRRTPFGFDTAALDHEGRLIEAIYTPGYLGVQWHPELLYPNDKDWASIFRWFVRDSLR